MNDQLAGAITLPDGTTLRGRGHREPLPPGPLPAYGLYLVPRRWLSRSRKTLWCPDWPADWIGWPDFRTPVTTRRLPL